METPEIFPTYLRGGKMIKAIVDQVKIQIQMPTIKLDIENPSTTASSIPMSKTYAERR